MTSTYERVEVITSVQAGRRWSAEKVRIVEATYLPGNTVSIVARRHGIGGNPLFTWRRLMAQGALTAASADTIGMRLGLTMASPKRLRAGVAFALQTATHEGHCGLPVEELVRIAEKLLEVPTAQIRTGWGLSSTAGASSSTGLRMNRACSCAVSMRPSTALPSV